MSGLGRVSGTGYRVSGALAGMQRCKSAKVETWILVGARLRRARSTIKLLRRESSLRPDDLPIFGFERAAGSAARTNLVERLIPGA